MSTEQDEAFDRETATRVLREFGRAIRGDWSNIDGRSIRDDINEIANWIDGKERTPDLRDARRRLGICLDGGAHWDHYCEEDEPCLSYL